MRRLALVALVLCLSSPVFARVRISGWCEQGNGTVTVGGLSATTKWMQSFPSSTVSVFATGTTNLSTIYADNSGTAKANPFTCASDGFYFFYVDAGRYDVKFSGTGITTPFTKADYLAFDPAQITYTVSAVAFSATPTFDAGAAAIFTMTLTNNVTSSTINNSASGQTIFFSLCQDGTGGRTFSWPASFLRPPTIASSASACTNAEFIYDGTNWRQVGATGDSLAASTIYNNGSPLTLPTGPDTMMGRASVDTEVNKTLTSPTINTPTITSPTTTGTDAGAETIKNKTLQGAASGNAVTLLNEQGPLAAVVGTGADATLYTYTVTANTVAAGKGIRVRAVFQHSTGTANPSYKLKLGSTTFETLTPTNDSASAGRVTYEIFNNSGVQNAQHFDRDSVFGQATPLAGIGTGTSAENFANALALTFTFSVAATDQVTPKKFVVELIQ